MKNLQKNVIRIDNDKLLLSNLSKEPKYLEVVNKGNLQRNILSRYKKAVGKPYEFDENLDLFKEVSKGNRNKWIGQENLLISEINIRNWGYASKVEFLNDYNEVEISYNYGYNYTNNGNKNWQISNKGINMGTPESESKIMSLKNNEVNLIVLEKEYNHTSSSMHRVKMTLKGKWVSTYKYEITFSSQASLNYNAWSTYDHAAYTAFKFNETSLT